MTYTTLVSAEQLQALMRRGDNECGPYQSPMEDGMQQFHEWYRRKMSAQERKVG